jgi:hypothetical protein
MSRSSSASNERPLEAGLKISSSSSTKIEGIGIGPSSTS